jgi:DNA-binding MarR family transcriptional regulator
MPQGSSTGSRPITAPAEEPHGETVDVARLRMAIGRLSRWLRRHELAGLTPTQLSALATVDRIGPLRLGDLAAAEGIAPSTLTRLVTVLEERGYVERCPVPGDARASTLAIAPAGHEVLERIREQSTILLAGRLRTLTEEQRAALAAALPALEQLADPSDPRSRLPGAAGSLPQASTAQNSRLDRVVRALAT